MKKLFAIIGILLIILIGMFIYKSNSHSKIENINISEIKQIEEYISKIYMWQEVTGEALPKFNNINEASDLWIWEVVKKDFEKYELTKEEIEKKAVEIFGDDFNKEFPKEGTDFIYYSEEFGKYLTTGMGLDQEEDSFFIKNINKTSDGYEVEIVEYLEDYENASKIEEKIENENENEIYDVYIKNLSYETIAITKSNESETKAIEVVKENIDKFTTKIINLKKDNNGRFNVESVK